MRPEEFHKEQKRQPFRPLRLHLSNGKTYEIQHPELVMIGRTVAHLYRPLAGYEIPVFDDYEVISLLHINNIEFIKPAGIA